MHLLYAVDFDARPTADARAFDLIQGHIATWLSWGSRTAVASSDLSADGSAELPATHAPGFTGADRSAAWEVQRADAAHALRVSVTQATTSGIEITTRVTVSDVDGDLRFRAGMSREYLGGALAPVHNTPVFQPGIVRDLAHDKALRLSVGSQLIDPRFQQIRGAEGVAELVAALRSPVRLPLILVHTRSPEAHDAAYVAAQKLVGLARVVTVTNTERAAVNAEIPTAAVPFGGAQLIWSDLTAPGIRVSATQIATGGREHLRNVFMPTLAPITALVRGTDEGWRQVRSRVQQANRLEVSERVRAAREAADVIAERDALRVKVGLLETDVEAAEALVNETADTLKTLRTAAEEADGLAEQVAYWRDLYHQSFDTPEDAEQEERDPWAEVPSLVPATSPNDTFLALVDACDSHIVFTDAAERSWRKINFPHPEDMTAALIALAQAAQKLYSGDPGTIGQLDDWFKLNFGLNVATSDSTIEKNKALRWFPFEKKQRDQTPHVKVRDAVKPNEVGRIHFALDSKGKRLIVNHVALKLYGI